MVQLDKKLPKKANKAIGLLEGLIEQLHYFYNGNEEKFRRGVLRSATEIENTLKDLAVNKKDTFKRINKKYEEYYRKKQEAIDNTVANATDTKLNDSIKQRYRHDFKKD